MKLGKKTLKQINKSLKQEVTLDRHTYEIISDYVNMLERENRELKRKVGKYCGRKGIN